MSSFGPLLRPTTALLLTKLTSLLLLLDCSSFFSVALVKQTAGFRSSTTDPRTNPVSRVTLSAEGGPPQYQKLGGVLRRSECMGKGSYLLSIDVSDEEGVAVGETSKWEAYEPGHVLAMEIQPPASFDNSEDETGSPSSMTTMSEKTQKDLEANGGWLRGPYTVSRGHGSSINQDGFQVLVKEVGYKSHVFAVSEPETPVRFGGRFKVPIVEGILAAAESTDEEDKNSKHEEDPTRRVVMIASGVGVGPCVGAIEDLMKSDSSASSKIAYIDLIASFRTSDEIAMGVDLDKLVEEPTSMGFRWLPVITEETGRLSSNGPEVLREMYLKPASSDATASPIRNTHYHIIGNGQLVNEWTAGLKMAGVPSSRVTTEAYFNHAAKPDPAAVETISEAVVGLDSTISKEVTTGKVSQTAASA